MGLDKLEKHRFSTLDAVGSHMLLIEAVVNCPPGHSTSKFPGHSASKLSPGHSTSKLSPGHFTSKQTVPHKGDSLLQGGSLCFKAECPGRRVYFEVKCPGGGLLRSNLPPGHFGGQVTS